MNTLFYQGSNQPCSVRAWGRLGSTFREYAAYFLAMFLLLASASVLAADKGVAVKEAVGKLMFTHGQVSLERSVGDIEDNGSSEQLSATRGDSVFEGDRIITAAA
ncbi:hypothetical protein, partial [Oceanospirillum maris]|uniref:hypothetical protein n=1 Tax=Oceanospirillum maris TaxID=64977 RepID=UPI0005690238